MVAEGRRWGSSRNCPYTGRFVEDPRPRRVRSLPRRPTRMPYRCRTSATAPPTAPSATTRPSTDHPTRHHPQPSRVGCRLVTADLDAILEPWFHTLMDEAGNPALFDAHTHFG